MSTIEHEQRARVAAIAREWIGTRYRHNARLKGVGADCTFFAAIYMELGLISTFDIPHASPQFHLHSDEEVYLDFVRAHARETDTPQVGDVVIYKTGRVYGHGAVIVDPGWPRIVHSDANIRRVHAAMGDAGWLGSLPRKFFTLWTPAD